MSGGLCRRVIASREMRRGQGQREEGGGGLVHGCLCLRRRVLIRAFAVAPGYVMCVAAPWLLCRFPANAPRAARICAAAVFFGAPAGTVVAALC